LFAPPGTPREIVGWIHDQIGRALEDETVQQKLRAAGVTPKIGPPEEVTKMLEWRIPEWADVIKSAGIRIN
jgi:tripartite-type tricarboxylate transporter receptor subunit TctC